MKFFYSFLAAIICLSAQPLMAQRTVFVPSSGANVGVLNDAIFGDTLATGERVDSNTVYLLEAGGYYLLNGSIENRFPLTIMVKDSNAGGRPVLQPAVDGGGSSSRAFRPRGDLYLSGIYVTNADNGGGLNTRIFRVSADGVKITLDDCHIDRDGQSAFRLDNSDISIFMTNCVVSNIGQTSSLDNGRVIDDRGNAIDSIWMENNTFYNITSTIIRDDGEAINFLWFRHNTSVNLGQQALEVGPVAEATITNNLFVNAGFAGISPSDDGTYIIDIDTLFDGGGMALPQTINFKNNNFITDTAAVDASYPDSVMYTPRWNPGALAFVVEQGSAATLTAELVTFTDGPDDPSSVIVAIWDTSMTPLALDDGGATTVNQLPFDFAYETTAASATGSTAGQQLGDLNWWGVEALGIEDRELGAQAKLRNFPNPFSSLTTIEYELQTAASVQLRLYNQNGQQLQLLFNGPQLPGVHRHQLDAGQLPAGIYYYQLQADEAVTTQKMVLLK